MYNIIHQTLDLKKVKHRQQFSDVAFCILLCNINTYIYIYVAVYRPLQGLAEQFSIFICLERIDAFGKRAMMMIMITTMDVVKTDDDIGLWDWLEMKNRKREM